MKVAVSFLLLALAIDFAESLSKNDDKLICVENAATLKLLYGRDGLPGPPGIQGEQGMKGYAGPPGIKGEPGLPGTPGEMGYAGRKGDIGERGPDGLPGHDGADGRNGEKGDRGVVGETGEMGDPGPQGKDGEKGRKGSPGIPGGKVEKSLKLHILSSYYVAQSGYYDNLYHVTSQDLTDGRTDSGGWGSETAKIGNFIQANYGRPINVTSVTVAGGFIPSWNHDIKQGYGKLDLEYSLYGKIWRKAKSLISPVAKVMITHDLPKPITAQYWRLRSTENKWVGTTEFALKPLIN